MELKIESMKNLKQVVEKCLDELMKKSDLTPSETKTALDAFRLHDELCCRIEDCMKEEDRSENGYSGHGEPYRQYHITSYGMPERAIHMSRADMTGRNNGWYDTDVSMRSMSHEDPYYRDGYSDRRRGYSRHSISDRVVSMIEDMMDTAKSDYEQQELQKYIRAIRAMGMSD